MSEIEMSEIPDLLDEEEATEELTDGGSEESTEPEVRRRSDNTCFKVPECLKKPEKERALGTITVEGLQSGDTCEVTLDGKHWVEAFLLSKNNPAAQHAVKLSLDAQIRASWTVDSTLEIFSTTSQKWFTGKVNR